MTSGPFPSLASRVKQRALDLGFDLVGIARAELLTPEADRFREWLALGRQGQMKWLDRTADKRSDPSKVLDGVRSIISLAVNYRHPDASRGRYHVSKYAQGEDYHRVLEPRLRELCSWIRTADPDSTSLWYVDTGPVMEKAWAQRSGLGWIGKNATVINSTMGSWFFLGTVLTTLELEPDAPVEDACDATKAGPSGPNQSLRSRRTRSAMDGRGGCGTCTLCIDACPTEAIVEPYVIDSNRCISYLTIEHRGRIDPVLAEKMGTELFGCDICQDVCPWNSRAPETSEEAFSRRPIHWEDSALESVDRESFPKVFRASAVKRAKWEGFRRNLEIARANADQEKAEGVSGFQCRVGGRHSRTTPA